MKKLNLNDIINFVNLLNEEELEMLKEVIIEKEIEEECFLCEDGQIKKLEKKFNDKKGTCYFNI